VVVVTPGPFKGGTKLAKIDELLEQIGSLTLIEASELVKAMEEKFGVTAAAPVAVAAAAGTGEAAPAAEEKTTFDVILESAGDKKIQVIKVVREITSLGLAEAKNFVETAPQPIKQGLSKEEAEEIKGKLEEQGATVSIK
jgi:large subunit ribosomal protein L7/L12